jgi:hypothetical protein
MELDRREFRELKRIVKRKGNQHARRSIKRAIAEDPIAAVDVAMDYGRFRTEPLNGADRDPSKIDPAAIERLQELLRPRKRR